MDFTPRERLGIFLIVVSFWYLINVKIFDTLHPFFAIPGSLIFIAGLWLLLSLPAPTTRTSTYIPTEATAQALTAPVKAPTPKPVSKPSRKPTKKSKSKLIKKTKPSKK